MTPAHLICARLLLDLYDIDSDSIDPSKEKLTRRAKYIITVLDHFKKRWKTAYLTSIREKTREHGKPLSKSVNIGDIVHISKDKTPRQFWRIGRIEKLLTGRDNLVRAVELITLDKAKNIIRLKRPLKKLFPLELSSTTGLDIDVVSNTEPLITMIRDEDIVQRIV